MKRKQSDNFRILRRGWILFCTAALLLCAAMPAVEAEIFNENADSPEPVLMTAPNAARALAADADVWHGALPRRNVEIFQPGQRVVVFVTNISLLPDEGANAFKAFAEDRKGLRYRLVVEDIQRLPKQDWIYGLTIRLYDQNAYNGQPPARGDVLLDISWRGNASNRVRLGLGSTGGAFKDDLTKIRPSRGAQTESLLGTAADRQRFMEQAAFGPSNTLDFRLRQIGISRWIDEQFYKPYPTIPYPNYAQKPFDADTGCPGDPNTDPNVEFCRRNHYWIFNNQKWLVQEALYGDDQLHRRVSWALHKIWVISGFTINQQRWMQEYTEILDKNAFGNYRDLMREMTLNPAMGEYLDMVRSNRWNPNENYPRELLQLFTTGLYMLNQDGSLILDNQGNRIPTYDQEKINQFTKIFTGWTRCDNGLVPACSNAVLGAPNFIDPMHLSDPNAHDQTAKTLFNYPGAPNQTIPACTNCTTYAALTAYANDSLNKTLDNIFYHPNVAPFVGKLLIQHLVTSDPTPAYVGRVAAAFNNNGAGVRGDMKAVVRAILLDPEARGSRKTDPTYGKLREPLQYMTNFLRTFNVRASYPITINGVPTSPPASCQNRSDGNITYQTYTMGQDLMLPATVFSYYPPDYVVPGTDISGPEFALANTGTSFERNNHIMGLSFGWNWFEQTTEATPFPWTPCGTSIDVSEAVGWAAADPSGNSLIEGLNAKMMHGTMSEAMKSKIRTALNFNVPADLKARQAIYLVASSSQYQIQR